MENQDKHRELEIQKRIAYTAGLLQGDITIKTLLESLAEGVVFINESGRIILINDKLAELTGQDKHDVMGKGLDIFIPEGYQQKHTLHLDGYFRNPRIRSMGIGMELTAKRKDGSTFPVEISISFLNTGSGKLGIGFITDITSRKKVENELKERNIELDAYAHTVAHDLNSSISGIVGLSEILTDPENGLSEDEHHSYLKEIAQSGKKMTNIIKGLLLFASMKKEEVELSEVDMGSSIQSACQRLKYQIEEKAVDININEKISNCLGQPLWVEEIWFNLLSNAIKYGGDRPRIKIYSSQSDNEMIKYSVEDQGKGVPSGLLPVIFNDRDRNKDRLTKGSGFGLSIVKRIIEKLGGDITVQSEEEKGSIFSFYLKKALSHKLK